jgi:hypothetical protein
MLRFWRRWLSRVRMPGAPSVHLVTWRLAPGQRPLTALERGLVCRALRHREGELHRLLAYVVMDDHVHVLVQPVCVPLTHLADSWASFTAHELQCLSRRGPPVWQADVQQRAVRGDEDLRLVLEYIVGNPWKRWPFIKGYPWVWEAGGDAPRS